MQPAIFSNAHIFFEGGVYRFMEHRFLKIMIADTGLYVFQIQDEEMPFTLTKGGFITTVDHHMMQLLRMKVGSLPIASAAGMTDLTAFSCDPKSGCAHIPTLVRSR